MKKLVVLFALALLMPLAAQASTCELSVAGDNSMNFNPRELTVPAGCETVRLTFTNNATLPRNVWGHSWVLVETANLDAMAAAARQSTLDKSYIPDDARILAHTQLLGPGESETIEFSAAALRGKDLTFFCSLPAHVTAMRGKLIVN